EMQYWHAVALANAGKMSDALPMFKKIFAKDNNWRILTERLPDVGLLTVKPEELKSILLQ
ncbi:MAG TPA: Zn-dependent protease, partial [bacterium]|nr:Zn-dependent protease [bacterium]